jgi:hypothetical protein
VAVVLRRKEIPKYDIRGLDVEDHCKMRCLGGDFVGVLLPKSSSVCSFAEIRLLQVSIIVPVLGCCAGL